MGSAHFAQEMKIESLIPLRFEEAYYTKIEARLLTTSKHIELVHFKVNSVLACITTFAPIS